MSNRSLRGYPTSTDFRSRRSQTIERLSAGPPPAAHRYKPLEKATPPKGSSKQIPAGFDLSSLSIHDINAHLATAGLDLSSRERFARSFQGLRSSMMGPGGKAILRKLKKLAKRIPAGRILDLVDLVNDLFLQVETNTFAGYDIPGFVLQGTCNSLPIQWQGNTGDVGCLVLQAGGDPLGTPIAAGTNHVHLANRYPVGASHRWDSVQRWERTGSGATQAVATYTPGTAVVAVPGSTGAQEAHRRLPLSVVRNRVSTGLPEATIFDTRVSPPKTRPQDRPTILATATVSPGGGGKFVRPSVGTHRQEPPGPGSKEIKARLTPLMRGLYFAVDVVTETKDYLDAIFQALPPSARRGVNPNNLYEMAEAIIDNYRDIDVSAMVYNLAYNYIEDKIVGTANRKKNEFALRNDPTGSSLAGARKLYSAMHRL